jgi:hypothetical protein
MRYSLKKYDLPAGHPRASWEPVPSASSGSGLHLLAAVAELVEASFRPQALSGIHPRSLDGAGAYRDQGDDERTECR